MIKPKQTLVNELLTLFRGSLMFNDLIAAHYQEGSIRFETEQDIHHLLSIQINSLVIAFIRGIKQDQYGLAPGTEEEALRDLIAHRLEKIVIEINEAESTGLPITITFGKREIIMMSNFTELVDELHEYFS